MPPAIYAIWLTTSVVLSLVMIGWVGHVVFRVPTPLWTFAMVGTAIVAFSAAILGYLQWLKNQHEGAKLEWDRRALRVTIPIALLVGAIAWLALRAVWEGPVIGDAIVFVSFFVTTLVLGCMISMRVITQ